MSHAFTPAIIVHLAAAIAALVLGGLVFLSRKGDVSHRIMGRIWVGLMLVTAISTVWIQTSGHYSWIHLLSVGTLAGLAAAVTYAVRGNIAQHRKTMRSVYIGGLVIAGAFTLLPQRLLGDLLWHQLVPGLIGA